MEEKIESQQREIEELRALVQSLERLVNAERRGECLKGA